MISVFLQMIANKKHEATDLETQKLKAKMNQQTKKYNDSRKTMLTPTKKEKVD
jgi:hypothetical protein